MEFEGPAGEGFRKWNLGNESVWTVTNGIAAIRCVCVGEVQVEAHVFGRLDSTAAVWAGSAHGPLYFLSPERGGLDGSDTLGGETCLHVWELM